MEGFGGDVFGGNWWLCEMVDVRGVRGFTGEKLVGSGRVGVLGRPGRYRLGCLGGSGETRAGKLGRGEGGDDRDPPGCE
jgi:hypothetical protein